MPTYLVCTTCRHILCARHADITCVHDMLTYLVFTTCRHILCVRHADISCVHDMPTYLVFTTCRHILCARHADISCVQNMPTYLVFTTFHLWTRQYIEAINDLYCEIYYISQRSPVGRHLLTQSAVFNITNTFSHNFAIDWCLRVFSVYHSNDCYLLY